MGTEQDKRLMNEVIQAVPEISNAAEARENSTTVYMVCITFSVLRHIFKIYLSISNM